MCASVAAIGNKIMAKAVSDVTQHIADVRDLKQLY
jgi:hypothetical protein